MKHGQLLVVVVRIRLRAIPLERAAEAFLERHDGFIAENLACAGDVGLRILDVARSRGTVTHVDRAADELTRRLQLTYVSAQAEK